MLGSNRCTSAPDKMCYPSNNGWSMCCKETPDGSSCSKDEPCEDDEVLPNPVPAPSDEEPVAEEPVATNKGAQAFSSSAILSMSSIVLAGTHVVTSFAAGML